VLDGLRPSTQGSSAVAAVDSEGGPERLSIRHTTPLRGTLGRIRDAVRRVPSWALLATLVATIAAVNVYWRVSEARPPHWDMAYHLANSLFYLHRASGGDLVSFLVGYQYYPPFTYWVTDLFYAGLGTEAIWVAVLSNVVWLAVLVFATYGIGRHLWSEAVGWLAVLFVVTAPMVLSASKEYMLDVPLTATAALALYLLIRADGFSSRRYSILLGVTVGCGLLVKWTFPLVLMLPVLYATATALSESQLRHEFSRLRNALGAAALTFLIAGPWYVHNFHAVATAGVHYNSPGGIQEGSPQGATLATGIWYLWKLLDPQLYLVPTVMLLIGVAFCFRRREFAARNLYPILLAVSAYLMFTLLPTKDTRFTLPMLPALAVIASSWISYISSRARTWIMTAYAVYGAITFVAVSFGTSLLPTTVSVNLPRTSFAPHALTLFAQRGYIIGPPTDEDWHQADPFRTIASFPKSERSLSYSGPDTIWFNATGLTYYSSRYGVRQEDAASAAFLLLRSEIARSTPMGYRPLERWRLPDGGTLVLYKHR
jgi:4-amino-4-deoxy-L-arabinose transferase-like glycosyltransferase